MTFSVTLATYLRWLEAIACRKWDSHYSLSQGSWSPGQDVKSEIPKELCPLDRVLRQFSSDSDM
jgi:hypothetical protein